MSGLDSKSESESESESVSESSGSSASTGAVSFLARVGCADTVLYAVLYLSSVGWFTTGVISNAGRSRPQMPAGMSEPVPVTYSRPRLYESITGAALEWCVPD